MSINTYYITEMENFNEFITNIHNLFGKRENTE